MAFVVLRRCDHITAALVKGALESEGVTVLYEGSETADPAYGTLPPPFGSQTALLVPAEEEARAREVLAELEGG